MNNNDELALKLAKLAKNAGADEWQAKKISGDQYVIRKGSYRVESGFCTYQEIAEIDDNSTRLFVAYASPANILALLAERDADKKRIAEEVAYFEKLRLRIAELQTISTAAEKLVRCKGRYHSEQNYRSLAALFGVTTPDLPPLETEARTVRLNAADIINVAEGKNHAPGRMIPIDTLRDYCAAAGIKLEVGE